MEMHKEPYLLDLGLSLKLQGLRLSETVLLILKGLLLNVQNMFHYNMSNLNILDQNGKLSLKKNNYKMELLVKYYEIMNFSNCCFDFGGNEF